jgi:farnesyl-diphosphate farnesyltransferase
MNRKTSHAVLGLVQTPAPMDRLLERTSRTFALTIPLLPEPTRCEVTVAYLLFRVADTLEDATLWPRDRKLSDLEAFARVLRNPSSGDAERLAADWAREPPCEHAGYRELLSSLPEVMTTAGTLSGAAREAISAHTLRTIDGMASFVRRERDGILRLGSLADLQGYCYAVAGIVGEMLTELFLLDRPGLAVAAADLRRDAPKFGEALQLVNILKDAASDWGQGRRYLPEDVDRARVFALAREDLSTAGHYTSTLERAGAPRGVVGFNALPMMLAWATLARVEAEGPGSKLTRAEVGAIVSRLEVALREGGVGALWMRMQASGYDAGSARLGEPDDR